MPDLFKRTVFRSEGGESEYDPYTYTMRLFQPSSDRLDKFALHEILHWLQHMCYTFSGFRSALIHLRDELTKQILIKYGKYKADFQRHQLLFSLPAGEAFFNSSFDYERMDEEVLLHQIVWRDALICEHLFLHMSSFYKNYDKVLSSVDEVLQPELLIPRMLLHINNWAIGTLGYRSVKPRAGLKITDIADHPKLSNFGQAEHAGIKLDTINIIEGMSVTHEIYYLQAREREEEARNRLEQIINTPYYPAIKIFLDIMGFAVRHDNIARMALMFLAIAEMSLNPPLPPFGIINKLELDWNKIYPPLRFIELSHIARRKVGAGGYILGPYIAWIFDWTAGVEELYLLQGGMFSCLVKDIDGYLPSEKSVPFLALIAEEKATMRLILKEKRINTIGMAEKFPQVLEQCTGLELYAMLRHAHILFMNFFRIERPFSIPFMFELVEEALYLPPLTVLEDGENNSATHVTSGWSKNFAGYLIDYNLFHYPLHDLMLRQEPRLYLQNSPLIDKERRKTHWNQLQKTFSNII